MSAESVTHPTLAAIASRAKVQYRTVEQMVVAAIREAILSGVFPPGERLRQETLAEELGVSRVPIRGALRKLESEGLVVSAPHRGATVRVLEAGEIEETYELRILLETYALRSAIGRITPEQLDELRGLADEIDARVAGDAWLEVTERFYKLLYEIAARPLTADIIGRLRANVGRYWLSLKVLDQEGSTHRIIVDAIAAGDPVVAEQWLADHLTRVSKELQRRIQEQRSATTE